MPYMTYEEQLLSHSKFLIQSGLHVDEIKIGQGFVRCCSIDQRSGRKELCYSTKASLLRNGMLGLATWIRGEKGIVGNHKTYGIPAPFFFGLSYPHSIDTSCIDYEINDKAKDAEPAKRARIFWDLSDLRGDSDYLQKKGAGYYGIRFRCNKYGKVAVIPLRDAEGTLWNCQLINSDGTKRFLRGARTKGLFHRLQDLINGHPIGVAESYITATTCQELAGIPIVTAFSCHNLVPVSLALQQKYPDSSLIIFADNDRHLSENKGVKFAQAACATIKRSAIIVPKFDRFCVKQELTDWNDLLREIGREETKMMMLECLEHARK
jgi:Toprim domain